MGGAAEETVGEEAAGCDGNRGEFDVAADVAEGVDMWDVGVLVLIGYDVAFFALFDACGLESEVFDFGGAADGPEKAIEIEGGGFGGGVGVVEGQFAGSGVF